MLQQLRNDWAAVKRRDLKSLLTLFHSKDAPPFVQLIKYGLCGVLAVIVHNLVFAVLSHWINPAVDMGLGDSVRAFRATVNNAIAFLFSNFTAYYTNAKWVFVRGRHRPAREFLLFTAVSAASFAAGLILVPVLIKGFGVHTWITQGVFVVTSALINFLCRKFVVFQR